MCGIIGVTGNKNAAGIVVEGLRRLEYRGYDSAGVATVAGGKINRVRAEGKIRNLESLLEKKPVEGTTGIGHTRWATHGAPVEKNAHPHATEKVAVVHNGIIENYLGLRKWLIGEGYKFLSDTDTEVIPVIITYYLDKGETPKNAVIKAIAKLEGAYALGIVFASEQDVIYASRHGAPLVLGYGKNEKYIASDALALAGLSSEICYLEEGDIAEVRPNKIEVIDKNGAAVQRKITQSNLAGINIGKENYRHFMQKEIFEQPSVIGDNLHAYFNAVTGNINLPNFDFSLAGLEKITIIACGTSYYAGKVATYWFEKFGRIPAEADIASEFRYRNAILPKNGMCIFISQSGETADTLAALKYAKARGQKIVSIVNTVQSSIARESDIVLPIYSGPEIGVASTKAFTTQLCTLAFLVMQIAREKLPHQAEVLTELTRSLLEVPALISKILEKDEEIKKLALHISDAKNIIYMGRGVSFPLALEASLKLKEISYIHSEAIAAGELKHGPIALIDENIPVVVIAPGDELFEKCASNVREVAARGGRIILFSDKHGIEQLKDVTEFSVEIPEAGFGEMLKNLGITKVKRLLASLDKENQEIWENNLSTRKLIESSVKTLLNPMVYAVPVQMLAYHVAVAKGTDVDQPRNLAKSVTVE